MSTLHLVTASVDSENVGWIVFGSPAVRVNVFNPATQTALRVALAELAGLPVKAVVILSAHEKIFVAGADLHWLAELPDVAAATAVARDGQELFNVVADFKVPVICAIHGACAGGGYELALACAWRLASDGRETVVGLPEVGLGLIPGWGGCTRLPRLIGAEPAVAHMLNAILMPAAVAKARGLVDEVVPAAELKTRALAAAVRFAKEGVPARPGPAQASGDFFAVQRQRVAERFPGELAPLAVIDAVEKSADLALPEALAVEAAFFGGLAAGAGAKNLIAAFLLKESARKTNLDAWFSTPRDATLAPAPKFRHIGVVGAGVMGAGIAHACAAQGYGVILCDQDREAITRAVLIIRELFAAAEARGQLTAEGAHKMTGGIGVTTSLEDFDLCDLVIETISEDATAKQKLLAELSGIVKPECLLASNTSTFALDQIGAEVIDRSRLVGLRFFQPVSRTGLVELSLTPATSRITAERALSFLKSLGKAPLVGRPAAGFFVTRVLFFYLNAACRLWEEGVATEAIDAAMRGWGWAMGPLRWLDEIGLDVAAGIQAELGKSFPDRFSASPICERLVAGGLKGRKNGVSSGFYDYSEGEERLNARLGEFSPPARAMAAPEICARLNGVFLGEAQQAFAEGVLQNREEADLALLLGAGFPAFRGAPFRQKAALADSPN